MVHTITLKELRPELPTVINSIDERLDRYVITKHGKPVAVMMNIEDYEGLLETLEILADKELLKRLKRAEKEIDEGKGVPLKDVRAEIEKI